MSRGFGPALFLPFLLLAPGCDGGASPGGDDGARFRFVDVTADAGVRFRHVHGGTGRRHLPETMGGGAAWLDYDGDGNLDLFFVQSGALPGEGDVSAHRNALFRNRGDGTFADATDGCGDAARTGYGQGVTAGDFDGDGRPDLYVTAYGRNTLLRNAGAGSFSDLTAEAGVGDERWGTSCASFDMEGDGDLDLYVVNYVEFGLDDYKRLTGRADGFIAYPHPDRFRSEADVLYRNEGDGSFTDVTDAAGIHDLEGKGLGVVAVDVEGDGDLDLYVANDGTPNFLFENLSDGTFRDATLASGTGYNADGQTEAGMGIAVGDVDADLLPDLFVTHLDLETNTLYVNRGALFFVDETLVRGLGLGSLSLVGFGTGFLDADTDGDLDLLVGNGHIIDNIAEIQPGAGIAYRQPALLFENDGDGRFAPVEALPRDLAVPRVVRAAAFADYDNDGDTDVVLVQNDDSAALLRNDSERHGSFLSLHVVDDEGRTSHGVRVVVRLAGAEILAQSVPGASYCSSNDPRILVGLPAAELREVEVFWPTGARVTLREVKANSFLRVSPRGAEIIR